jgi:hypothetical protein
MDPGSAAHHFVLRSIRGTQSFAHQNDDVISRAATAAFRRQSRHRQSPPSSGIGSRAASSAHQHGPARLQVNSVPHCAQARRREAGFSNRFVMNRTEFYP